MNSLHNKIALITGGGRDIGRAISQKLAQEGAQVILTYFHSEEKAYATVTSIEKEGGAAVAIKSDLRKPDQVKKLAEEIVSRFGYPNILVNNAGGLVGRKSLGDMTDDFYDEVMDLNFRSLFLVCRAFIPRMPRGGSVINVSSLAARNGGGNGSGLYAAAKGAVSTFTRSMAKEFGASGIRVNAICPGLIDTLFHDTYTPDEVRKKVVATTPVGREGTPDDVAELVYFLASDQSGFITGTNFDINGGTAFY